ncbi:methyltransferase domain-containing protein [Spiroplasma endosymbiont of Virgichneumon dumeticola]|uniref:methyltransferase domain-containing protein n=1 Tax=Spiroplasma endosymbiont of Virgichneumon dumeticola TaxID=3139323 RepID=UPI0035C93E15
MNIQTIAYKILLKVILEKGYCNVLLENMMQDKDLSMFEKELIEKLVFGTLKNQIYLDYILNQIWLRLQPTVSIPFKLTIFLWTVLYEIYFLEITDRQLFTEDILNIVKTINKNMVHISSTLLELCFAEFRSEFNLPKAKRSTIRLIKHSYPQWLYNLVESQFSTNIALQLMKDNLKQPLISFRVNTLKTTVQHVLTNAHYQTFGFQPSNIVSDGIISNKSIFNTKLYKEGNIIKQDQASMIVSHMLAPKPYDEVLDMCAGIGSKTAHIAALMTNKGTIIATDINANRLKFAHQYLIKLGVTNTNIIVCDAITFNFKQKFDKILIDAPSTASGLIKRKPEVKLINWSKEEIDSLITVQTQLLEKAYHQLKPQGILLYVTCTFNIEENQNQIETLIKKFSKMTIIEERQIFGFHEGTDGFYICKLKKEV